MSHFEDCDSVTSAVIRLFRTERFYAELVMAMDRIISDKVPTLGVCIKDNVQLHINMKYFESLSLDEQVSVLKHECQHILNDHIPRMKEIAPEVYDASKDVADAIINSSKHRVLNVAADMAINPGIPNLPEHGVFPKMFKLKDGETFEYYFQKLKENDQNSEKAAGMNTIDDHSIWAESEGDKESLKEKIKAAVNAAADRAKAVGSLPGDLELLINRLNHQTRDWRRDLQRFAARSLSTLIDTSRKKRNRRYGIVYPGVVKTEQLHIGVAIDTSGSVSDEALNQFMAEIAKISKYAKVTVVEADSEIQNTYEFDPKKTYKIKGRGGTAYQPAFDWFNENAEIDGVIYFGDMDCFDTEEIKKPKYPVMWAIIGEQDPPAKFGFRTKIEVKRK